MSIPNILKNSEAFTGNAAQRFFFSSSDGTKIVSIADRGHLRWCHSTSTTYKSLDFDLQFEGKVEGAVSSTTADYVCIYNRDELHVLEVPWMYSGEENGLKHLCHIYSHKFDENHSIKQVLFHPKSYLDSTILVLTNDDSIFIINTDDNRSDKNMINLNSKNSALGLYDRINDIQKIIFSQDGLSLLILSAEEGCDIFTIYPCLPRRWDISLHEIDTLFAKSLLLYNNMNVNTTPQEKRNIIKQLNFMEKIRGQKTAFRNDKKPLILEDAYLNAQPQGPFSMTPYPNELYDFMATDINIIQITQNISLLAIAFSNGTVLLFLSDLEPIMSWDISRFPGSNSLALLEQIKLEITDNAKFLSIPGTYGKFVVTDNVKSNFFVNTCDWSTILAQIIDNSDIKLLANLKVKSNIENLQQIASTFKSIIYWKNENISCNYIISDKKIEELDMLDGISSTTKDKLIDQSNSQVESKLNLPELKNGLYEVKFARPLTEIQHYEQIYYKNLQNQNFTKIPLEIRSAPLKNSSNENQLESLTKISESYMKIISMAQTLGYIYRKRMIDSIEEFSRQIETTYQINKFWDNFEQIREVQNTKIDKVKEKQQKLMERLSSLYDKVEGQKEMGSMNNSNISAAESEWFAEIKRSVIEFNSYVRKASTNHQELEFIKEQQAQIANQKPDISSENGKEWNDLQQLLRTDLKIISEFEKKCDTAVNGINQLKI